MHDIARELQVNNVEVACLIVPELYKAVQCQQKIAFLKLEIIRASLRIVVGHSIGKVYYQFYLLMDCQKGLWVQAGVAFCDLVPLSAGVDLLRRVTHTACK